MVQESKKQFRKSKKKKAIRVVLGCFFLILFNKEQETIVKRQVTLKDTNNTSPIP